MSKVKGIINRHCQKCKQTIKEKIIRLEIRGKKWKLCEDCVQQAELDEDYRNLSPCQVCYKPVYDKDAMLLGRLVHEKCYDGSDGM